MSKNPLDRIKNWVSPGKGKKLQKASPHSSPPLPQGTFDFDHPRPAPSLPTSHEIPPPPQELVERNRTRPTFNSPSGGTERRGILKNWTNPARNQESHALTKQFQQSHKRLPPLPQVPSPRPDTASDQRSLARRENAEGMATLQRAPARRVQEATRRSRPEQAADGSQQGSVRWLPPDSQEGNLPPRTESPASIRYHTPPEGVERDPLWRDKNRRGSGQPSNSSAEESQWLASRTDQRSNAARPYIRLRGTDPSGTPLTRNVPASGSDAHGAVSASTPGAENTPSNVGSQQRSVPEGQPDDAREGYREIRDLGALAIVLVQTAHEIASGRFDDIISDDLGMELERVERLGARIQNQLYMLELRQQWFNVGDDPLLEASMLAGQASLENMITNQERAIQRRARTPSPADNEEDLYSAD